MMMERRPFIAWTLSLLTAPFAAVATPATAAAQPAGELPGIGLLLSFTPVSKITESPGGRAFLEGLRALGWVDGQTVRIEVRSFESRPERVPELVAELLRLRPAVFVTGSDRAVHAAKRATATVPLVFVGAVDPVGTGLVASLARPGGNATGLAWDVTYDQVGKNLQILKDTLPGLSRVAILWNEGPGVSTYWRHARAAAQALGLSLQSVEVRDAAALDRASVAIRAERAEALFVWEDAALIGHRRRVLDLAQRHRLATLGLDRSFAAAGGLMAVDSDYVGMWRGVAAYVDRILRGAKPADLPVEQPTTFDLVIISGPPRRSASPFPPRCWRGRTR